MVSYLPPQLEWLLSLEDPHSQTLLLFPSLSRNTSTTALSNVKEKGQTATPNKSKQKPNPAIPSSHSQNSEIIPDAMIIGRYQLLSSHWTDPQYPQLRSEAFSRKPLCTSRRGNPWLVMKWFHTRASFLQVFLNLSNPPEVFNEAATCVVASTANLVQCKWLPAITQAYCTPQPRACLVYHKF